MRCKKKYEEGGLFEPNRRSKRKIRKAEKDSERRRRDRQDNLDLGTPSNPRFLSGAPTRNDGDPIEREVKKEKKKKPKLVKRKGKLCVATGGTQQGRGGRTASSCRS